MKDDDFKESVATAEEGLTLMRLFIQLKSKADRDAAIRLLEDFVHSSKTRN